MINRKRIMQLRQKHFPTNLRKQTMLCMLLFGGKWYLELSINEKINHRAKISA